MIVSPILEKNNIKRFKHEYHVFIHRFNMFQHGLTINNSDLTICRRIKTTCFFLSIGGMFGRFGRHAIEARTSGFVWSNPRVVDTKPTDMSRSSNVKHGLEKLCLSSDRLFLTDRKNV